MRHVFCVLFGLLLLPGVATASEYRQLSGPATVVDGDTIRFEHIEGSIELWGVDAPEIWTEAGERAKLAMEDIVWAGQPLSCTDAGQTLHGRTVARCLDKYGRDIAERLILQGYARAFKATGRGQAVPFPDAWLNYARAEAAMR
ncbi:MAG: thermonuclease family protein [Alphaproteobacteria bacterium]|nr:thermonuclease family protein [Alphaproteobacteria bacterium]